jgi:hypothetical protein
MSGAITGFSLLSEQDETERDEKRAETLGGNVPPDGNGTETVERKHHCKNHCKKHHCKKRCIFHHCKNAFLFWVEKPEKPFE